MVRRNRQTRSVQDLTHQTVPFPGPALDPGGGKVAVAHHTAVLDQDRHGLAHVLVQV